MVRKMLAKILTRLGCSVTEADDGQTAIDIISENLQGGVGKAGGGSLHVPFDLILMDSVMPRVSGEQATKIIKHKLGFSNPIIGVTGNILPSDTAGWSDCSLCCVTCHC